MRTSAGVKIEKGQLWKNNLTGNIGQVVRIMTDFLVVTYQSPNSFGVTYRLDLFENNWTKV